MVVVTGREPDSRRQDGAMSSSDAEDDFLEPATPTATQAGHALPLLPQEVPGRAVGRGGVGRGAGEKRAPGIADLGRWAVPGLGAGPAELRPLPPPTCTSPAHLRPSPDHLHHSPPTFNPSIAPARCASPFPTPSAQYSLG